MQHGQVLGHAHKRADGLSSLDNRCNSFRAYSATLQFLKTRANVQSPMARELQIQDDKCESWLEAVTLMAGAVSSATAFRD